MLHTKHALQVSLLLKITAYKASSAGSILYDIFNFINYKKAYREMNATLGIAIYERNVRLRY